MRYNEPSKRENFLILSQTLFLTVALQKPAAAASLPPTQLDKSEEPVISKTPSEEDKPSEGANTAQTKTPETVPTSASPESNEVRKKPAGAVSLFGGIDVFANKQAKSPLGKDDDDDDVLLKSSPPPMVKKKEEVKKSAVSLFDNDDEEDETDWSEPVSAPSKAADKNSAKVRACARVCVFWSCSIITGLCAAAPFNPTARRGEAASQEHRCVSGRGAALQSGAAEGQRPGRGPLLHRRESCSQYSLSENGSFAFVGID